MDSCNLWGYFFCEAFWGLDLLQIGLSMNPLYGLQGLGIDIIASVVMELSSNPCWVSTRVKAAAIYPLFEPWESVVELSGYWNSFLKLIHGFYHADVECDSWDLLGKHSKLVKYALWARKLLMMGRAWRLIHGDERLNLDFIDVKARERGTNFQMVRFSYFEPRKSWRRLNVPIREWKRYYPE